MSRQIFEALDGRWLHLFGHQLVFPKVQDGHIILAAWLHGCIAGRGKLLLDV